MVRQVKTILGANRCRWFFLSAEETFKNVVDLIRNVAMIWDDNTQGMTYTEVPIPDDMVEQVQEYRNMLVEAVAEYDDALLEKFFDNPDSITEDELVEAIHQGNHRYRYHPDALWFCL